MASKITLSSYDFSNLKDYPNVGYNKDNELVEFSFNGNSQLRPDNSKLIMTPEAKEEWNKCSKDLFYFVETYCYIHTQDHGKIKVQLRDYQYDFLNMLLSETRIIGMMSRQIGKTTTNVLYIVWNMCFKKDWVSLVVANEDELKKEIVEMIQTIYESLPPFLQLGVEKWNMGAMTLKVPVDGIKSTNKLRSAVTGKNAGRGKTPNFCLVDEAAWNDPVKAKAFFDSVKASLSSGTNNQFVMISTPNGYNIFHQYWKDSEDGKSKFKRFFADWTCVTGRDEKWKQNLIEQDNLTPEEWNQNYLCKFLGSSATLIDAETLGKLKWIKPIQEDFIINDFNLYKPINNNAFYLITVDTSKTVGKINASNDYISVNVLELNEKIEQVGTFRSNEYHYTDMAEILEKIGYTFNEAIIVIENNEGSGQSIADRLANELEYSNVYCDPKHEGEINGVRQNIQRRQISLSTLKKLIKNDILKINDEKTIDELFTFIKIGKKYQADTGANATDDIVMSLCLLVLFLIDELNEYEITLDNYLEGSVDLIEQDDSNDVDFFSGSIDVVNNDNSWLLS